MVNCNNCNEFDTMLKAIERAVILGWWLVFDEIDLFPFEKYFHAYLEKIDNVIFPGFGMDGTFNGKNYSDRFRLSDAFINRFGQGEINRFSVDELTTALRITCPDLPSNLFTRLIDVYRKNSDLTPRCIFEKGRLEQRRYDQEMKAQGQSSRKRPRKNESEDKSASSRSSSSNIEHAAKDSSAMTDVVSVDTGANKSAEKTLDDKTANEEDSALEPSLKRARFFPPPPTQTTTSSSSASASSDVVMTDSKPAVVEENKNDKEGDAVMKRRAD